MKNYAEARVTGFTLIEILVALTIIGVLLTFVAPLVLNRPDQARGLKVKNDFAAIETAMILYRLDNGRFPTSDEGLKILVNKENASEGYLASVPMDPWGNSYKLHFGLNGSVQIRSAGPDGFFDETGNSDDKISKKFNEHKRITAFSLIEILTVLAIVAIILTVPNWAIFENRLLKTAEDRLALTQTKIDMALLLQARLSSEQIIEVSLKPLCNNEEILIYLGGWTDPKKFICKNKDVEIDALGLLSFKDPS